MTSATCRSSGRRSGFVDIPQIKRKRTTAGGPAVVRKRPKGTRAVRLPPGFLGSVEGPGGSLQPDGVTDVEEPTAQTHDATIAVVNVSSADAYVESNSLLRMIPRDVVAVLSAGKIERHGEDCQGNCFIAQPVPVRASDSCAVARSQLRTPRHTAPGVGQSRYG
jgi:hypothetical protein